jgi:hypothetical protein
MHEAKLDRESTIEKSNFIITTLKDKLKEIED